MTDFRVKIDLSQLHNELAEHSEMYYDHAMRLVEARKHLKSLEDMLKLGRSKLYLRLRRENPQATEAAIDAMITISERYQEAVKEVQAATYQKDILESGRAALDHRKSCLGKEVDLFLSNYFSVPKATKGNAKDLNRAAWSAGDSTAWDASSEES